MTRLAPLLAASLLILLPSLVGCAPKTDTAAAPPQPTPTVLPAMEGEGHLRNLRQLTRGGENAEAYWSFDGRSLSMQSTRAGAKCDRIWRIDDVLSLPKLTQVSSGKGRTTCAYFRNDGRILYSSTHEASEECPPVPDRSRGYVWPVYDSYDVYLEDGTPLIAGKGYDAEATVCPVDGRIVFTSTRDGDLDLYVADADGKNVKRLTTEDGYDGGAFFNADCSKIVWRASRPQGAALQDYRKLLSEGLVRPSKLEIFVMNADGSGKRQVTSLGAAAFAPSFLDSGRILFSSNHLDPKGRNFDIFLIGVDGTGLERITTYEGFDGFPLISPDGKRLAFSSNRNGTEPGETNVFVADWVE
ncbi:MAG TPA: hypothetical protein VM638_03175 [Actinomycetota bacterium]|nr:hypothetical protein [Actinomycetota bacterium]